MSIPLVQNNEKDSINTSIIAIKKNLERINSILGLVDSGSDIDTSEFVKKSDIVDVVQSDNMNPVTSNAVVPVDTVTSGNMHSVTSNAVAEKLNEWNVIYPTASYGELLVAKSVNTVTVRFIGDNISPTYSSNEGGFVIGTVPVGYRPKFAVTIPISVRSVGSWNTATYYFAVLTISSYGTVSVRGKRSDISNAHYYNGITTYVIDPNVTREAKGFEEGSFTEEQNEEKKK